MKSLIILGAVATALLSPVPAMAAPGPTAAYENGRWWSGREYRLGTRYVVGDTLRERPPGHVARRVDLHGGFVIPPLAEAHNHWLEPNNLADYNRCYLADGVFYVRDLANLPLLTAPMLARLNRPDTVDFASAMMGFTGPGGHPVEIYEQLQGFGILPKAWRPDYDREAEFVVTSQAEVDARFAELVRQHPAIVKVFLLYSDRYRESLADPKTRGNGRGMDPDLLPHLVALAHGAGLKVAAHIYSVADVRNALAAGVDELAHMPGFRPDLPASEFQLTARDAAEIAHKRVQVTTTLSWLGPLQADDPKSYAIARRIAIANLRLLKAHHVRLLIGSDAFRRDVRPELEILQGLGVFSPGELMDLEADTARAVFPRSRVGSLSDGARADFLVLAKDPRQDIRNLGSISLRVKQGLALGGLEAVAARTSPDCTEKPPG